MHTKDLKTKHAPAAMVNWQEAGRTWPRPHPQAARLLRGLVWDQHYRHSHPQCEGGMPRSFELRTDIAPDRLQAVEGWAAGGGVRVPPPAEALEDVDPAGQARRRPASRRD